METVKTHRDLDVWKISMDFAVNLYQLTEAFPSEEKFGLVSQIRRAGISIPSNIAEGCARSSQKIFVILSMLPKVPHQKSKLNWKSRVGWGLLKISEMKSR